MKKPTETDLNFNTTNLLLFMYSKRKPLIIISIIAFVVSVLVSLLITPRFRSTVIFFPASSASVSEALISTSGSYGEKGILSYTVELCETRAPTDPNVILEYCTTHVGVNLYVAERASLIA